MSRGQWAAALRERLSTPPARALLALAFMILVGVIWNRDGAFFQWSTHRGMLREISVHGILACGMTLVIITAGIDLSVGSVLSLSAVSFALLTMPYGQSALTAIPAVLSIGLLAGAASGALVAYFRMQPFIVTLAMMVFARGLSKLIAGGKKVTSYVPGAGPGASYPEVFDHIDARILGGNVSVVTLIFLACVAITWVLLTKLRLGRYLYAVGGNREAARLSGVPIERVLIAAYALSGFFAAVGGVCQAAQETHGDPETGAGYELDAIAMVVLGGTSLMGGRGNVALTLIGALTIGYLQKILSINAYSTETRLMLTGVIILCAVLLQRGRGQRKESV
jgi:ribose transport system permease protein